MKTRGSTPETSKLYAVLSSAGAKIGYAAVALSLLASCGNSNNSDEAPRGDSGTTITKVITKSGYDCAVMDGPMGKAISCNFSHTESTEGKNPHGDSGTTITEAILGNGVLCAVMDGPRSKALDCDWNGPAHTPVDSNPQGDSGTAVTLVQLPKGPECAVMDGPRGKAISCNWS